jgi:hypothetical protein
MKSKGKFLVLTDMREAVGVETVVGRKVVVNEDHIIKIAAMEPHIAEVVNYSATVSFVDGSYMCETQLKLETQEEIVAQLWG